MSVDDSERPSGTTRLVEDRITADSSAYSRLTGDFYRGEVDRMSSWRSRLDQTTNWAVVVVAAILTWAFGGQNRPHYVILIGVFAVTAFLVMEAMRYREYDIWRNRVRTIQDGLLANLYDPENARETDWADEIAGGLRRPSFTISFREALTHRLRRVYIYLLHILLAAWVARITLLEPAEPWGVTASILGAPGAVVAGIVAAYYVAVVAVTVLSARGTRIQEFAE